jgi:hypothetical protein
MQTLTYWGKYFSTSGRPSISRYFKGAAKEEACLVRPSILWARTRQVAAHWKAHRKDVTQTQPRPKVSFEGNAKDKAWREIGDLVQYRLVAIFYFLAVAHLSVLTQYSGGPARSPFGAIVIIIASLTPYVCNRNSTIWTTWGAMIVVCVVFTYIDISNIPAFHFASPGEDKYVDSTIAVATCISFIGTSISWLLHTSPSLAPELKETSGVRFLFESESKYKKSDVIRIKWPNGRRRSVDCNDDGCWSVRIPDEVNGMATIMLYSISDETTYEIPN